MAMRIVRSLLVVGLLSALVVPSATNACPFCPSAGQTLLGETKQAHFIVFGTLSNPKRDPSEFGKGTTDMKIEVVVKDHEYLKGKSTITLPRYVPPDPKSPSKYLVFVEIYKGELDPYRGEAVPVDSKIADYLKGSLAIKDKDSVTRLNYFFENFDSPDWVISTDAFQEFSNSEYKDVKAASAKMSPDRVLKMLKDPSTSITRFGLLGMILGHIGKPDVHGPALRSFIDDPKVRQATGLDGLLAGYAMLDPKAGKEYLAKIIKDEKEEFLIRYAALRALRFFWEYRSDVISHQETIPMLEPLIEQQDIVDLAVDDLRKWEQWQLADKLIGLAKKPTHEAAIIQRSIIKYALSAPTTNKACAEYLAQLQKDEKQAERIRDIRELLELEKPRPSSPAPAVKQ